MAKKTDEAPEVPDWAKRLTQARTMRGLSGNELDDLAGNPQGESSRAERGLRPQLSAKVLMQTCRVLGVRSEWIWNGEEPMEVPLEVAAMTPDDLENRRLAAVIVRGKRTVTEPVIRYVVTNPLYNTPKYKKKKIPAWVEIFETAAIESSERDKRIDAERQKRQSAAAEAPSPAANTKAAGTKKTA